MLQKANTALLSFYAIIFFVTLIFATQILSEFWWYLEIRYYSVTLTNILIIVLLLLLPLFNFKKLMTNPSDIILVIFYFFIYAPAIIVPILITKGDDFHFGYYIYLFVLTVCFLFLQSRTLFIKRVRTFNLSQYKFTFIFSLIYAVSIVLLVASFGFTFRFVGLDDVYSIRAEFHEAKEANGGIATYLVYWTAYIFNPFILMVGLKKRKTWMIILPIVVQLYIFSFSAFKSHIGVLALEIILFYFFKRYKSFRTDRLFLIIMLLPLILVIIDKFLLNNIFLTNLITRRTIIVPGQLTYYFYDFFSSHPKTHLGHSIFKGFVSYPYSSTPPLIIGQEYFGRNMSANVGFFPDGYASFGYIGMILSTILVKVVLEFFDKVYLSSGKSTIVLVLTVVFSRVFNSAALPTILLTHGLLIMIFLFAIYPWSAKPKGNYKFISNV